jgi:hypothetical protein
MNHSGYRMPRIGCRASGAAHSKKTERCLKPLPLWGTYLGCCNVYNQINSQAELTSSANLFTSAIFV